MEYGIIGEKLSHSFSKEIHAKLFDYTYEICPVAKENLDDFMTKRGFKAINVTIPYKQDVIKYLDFIDPMAKEIGAVNTVVNKNGKLYGYNTDFLGLCDLISNLGIEIKDKKVLILGGGGTSKTAAAVAKSLLAKEVVRVSRVAKEGFVTYEEAKEKHSNAEIIINTTPCGMYPDIDTAAIDVNDYPNLLGVVDAVYNPINSKLVLSAKNNGIKAEGGLYMLVAQAVYAAEKFTDTQIDKSKIFKIYKEILKEKQNIVLIGMPASGKSTIGEKLAKELNMNFVDTDSLIVEKEKMPIPEIFKKKGEKAFRETEKEAVLDASKMQNTVIATGGGAILDSENVFRLSQNGRIYFIDRPLDFLCATSDRPLSSTKQDLEKRYNERYNIYLSSCHKKIDAKENLEDNIKMIKEDFLNENTCD